MPELPDVTVYVERIGERVGDGPLERIRLASPFVLRTAIPPLSEASQKRVVAVRRLGKRIVFELEGELFLVVHLMVAGRFRFLDPSAKIPGKVGLAAFDFPRGSLVLTEASTKKRASIHLVRGRDALAAFDRGGLELAGASAAAFRAAMSRENHTLKRALTDPTILSGVGNAYSDEILHRAKLSPVTQTKLLDDDAWSRLHRATLDVLAEWTDRLREESKGGFPEKVTAFREEMAVHGKFGKPCPVCGTRVQRIRYADNETNYCPTCQTGGKLLADRGLSRLLGKDWPKTLEELEERKAGVAPVTKRAAPRKTTERA
ncbi:MAG: DNA-formamidopyrimidine glycosylase family protein [Polyangiaceae bacterium]